MFKFPSKINISKRGMFFLIFLGAWYGSSGNYKNITGNLTLFCGLGTVPTKRRL